MNCIECDKEMEIIKNIDNRKDETIEFRDEDGFCWATQKETVGYCYLKWYCGNCNLIHGYEFCSSSNRECSYELYHSDDVRFDILDESVDYLCSNNLELSEALETACKNNNIDTDTLMLLMEQRSNYAIKRMASFHEELEESFRLKDNDIPF